jgi:hypothetical protein
VTSLKRWSKPEGMGQSCGSRFVPKRAESGEMSNPIVYLAVVTAAFLLAGGLLFATPTTLLIVPYLFAMLRKRNDGVAAHGVFEDLPNE